MNKRTLTWNMQTFWSTGRAAQAGWLLFLLLVFSMALPGLTAYREALQTACAGSNCLMGQFTPFEAQAALVEGETLADYGAIVFIVFLFTDVFLLLVAAVLIWRKPTHIAAVCGAFLFAALATGTLAQAAALTGLAGSLGTHTVQLIRFVQLALLLPAFALIPDGHFRPAWLVWAALACIPAAALVAFDLASPMVRIATGIVISLSIVGSILYRWVVDKQRQEAVTWLVVAVALLAGAQWMGRPILFLPLPYAPIASLPGMGFSPFPIFGMLLVVGGLTCLAVALLGEELFRVDVVLNRAIVYSFLTLFVVGVYVLIVGYLSLIFQSSGSLWLSLVATGVVAALFQPLREWVQRFVNRMIYGERDDPYTVISQLGQRLETIIASDEVIPTILSAVREALQVSYAAIALSPPQDGGLPVVSEDGQPTPVLLTLPLMYQNEKVGQLKVGPRQGESSFSQADRHLLEGLARQAGAAIHAARLNTDLQRARERLVIAQEEERRRIRRDLHDGLGASLAALNLQAGEVQRLMRSDLETAGERMGDLRASLREAIGDIRRVVYGLRPPALDELGLLDTLRSRIAQYQGVPVDPLSERDRAGSVPVQIRFDTPAQLPPLQAAVEVAVYRIVEEGLANIVHHARAKNATIELAVDQQDIRIMIQDDGEGMPEDYQPGVGLRSMRERAAELGGRMTVQSVLGQGTQICVWLPLFSGNGEVKNVE